MKKVSNGLKLIMAFVVIVVAAGVSSMIGLGMIIGLRSMRRK